ncbi:Os09g0565300, partial [Oryza sativa Japonica Group]
LPRIEISHCCSVASRHGLISGWKFSGKHCFNGRSLHHISEDSLNPYEQAISIIGKTLSTFDEDNRIPCFGFGDSKQKLLHRLLVLSLCNLHFSVQK